MHLDGEGAGSGLALALAAGAVAQAGEILLADARLPGGLVAGEVTGTGVVDEHFEVHLGFSAKAFDVGLEVPLVGADGAPQGIVILKRGAEAEGQDSGVLKAVGDHACMVFGGLLIHALGVFGVVLRHDNGQITGREEEGLVAEESGDSGEWGGPAVPAKFRKSLPFSDAVGVPRHVFDLPSDSSGVAPIER